MTIYLNKGGVLVDSSKIAIHGTNYPLRNLSAYKAEVRIKDIFDWLRGFRFSVITSAIITAFLFFYTGDLNSISLVLLVFVALFCIVLALLLFVIKEPTKFVFDHSYLSLTSAGTTKHALIVKDDKNDLVYDVRDALDEAIGNL